MKEGTRFSDDNWHFISDDGRYRVDAKKNDGGMYDLSRCHNDDTGSIIQQEYDLTEEAAKSTVQFWLK